MKTLHIVGIGAAVCVGVVAALQIDRQLQPVAVRPTLNWETPTRNLQPAAFEPATAPAAPFDFRTGAKKVMPSVVSVDRFNRARGFFGEAGPVRESGQGSGVILDKSGIIVTNNHVVERAEKVKVRLSDNRTFDAKVLGRDPRSDLAVLKIEATNLSPIELGERQSIEVGEWVMAVGNPLGFSNTVSVGVVSSLKRNLEIGNQGLIDAIQTDAAINPGNSGGALCDAQGRLIGVNSAIATPNQGSVGIGFAIPIDRVRAVVSDIVKLGYARYAGLGISYDPSLDGALGDARVRSELAGLASSDGVPSNGIIIRDASGSAKQVGLGQWDVLLAIDNQPVNSTFDLNKVLVPKKPGDSVTVKFWSKGQTKTATLKLQEVRPTL